jgi:hypothetical protein
MSERAQSNSRGDASCAIGEALAQSRAVAASGGRHGPPAGHPAQTVETDTPAPEIAAIAAGSA